MHAHAQRNQGDDGPQPGVGRLGSIPSFPCHAISPPPDILRARRRARTRPIQPHRGSLSREFFPLSIMAGQSLILMGNLHPLHVRVNVDEEDLPRLRWNAPAPARVHGDVRQ
jgi:hypothetical protein